MEITECSQYSNLAMNWRFEFNSWQKQNIYLTSRNIQIGSGAYPVSKSMNTMDSLHGGKAAGNMKLATHLHLLLQWRMRGNLAVFCLYAFTVCTDFTFTLAL